MLSGRRDRERERERVKFLEDNVKEGGGEGGGYCQPNHDFLKTVGGIWNYATNEVTH